MRKANLAVSVVDDAVSHARERFPFFHLVSLVLGLLIATGAAVSLDAPAASRDVTAAARPPRDRVLGTYQPRAVRQPVTVYIVDSQAQADILEENAVAGGTDDEGNAARPSGPREYLVGGSTQADTEIQQAANEMVEMNESSEAAGGGSIYRVVDLRRRR
jgi:hypothetical protein